MYISNTIIIFILVLWGFILLAALMLILFLLGKHTVKNNPNKAMILILNGNNVDDIFQGKLHTKTKKGYSYKYNNGKSILVPKEYKEVYCKNKRLLFLNHMGQLIASPFDRDIELSPDEKDGLITDLLESHIGSDSIRALRGKGALGTVLVAIIAFILGAVIVFGFTQFQKVSQQKQVTTQQQQQKSSQTPVEVK